jgi:hypothetical protein
MTAARRLLFFSCSQRTAVLSFFTLKCLQEIPKCIKGSPALTQDRRLFTPRDAKWLSFVWILLLQKSLRPLSCTNVQHTRRMALNTVLLFKFQNSSLLSILSLGLCTFFGYLPFQVFSRSFYAMSEEWRQVYQSDSSRQNSSVVKRKPVIFQERRRRKKFNTVYFWCTSVPEALLFKSWQLIRCSRNAVHSINSIFHHVNATTNTYSC